MNKIKFIKTSDGSIGLYNEEIKEIFHSKTGALKEAFEKFVYPSFINILLNQKEEVSILDICYGIGYNTKALLTLVSDNKVNIDCFEISKEFVMLSPFINDTINNKGMKLFLLCQLLKNNINVEDILSVLNLYNEFIHSEFFLKDILDFISLLEKTRYKNIISSDSSSFLHNI